jgi:hypothetical protein
MDIVHGRLMAFVREWPALVVRDLTPGRERLQRTRLLHIDRASDMCFCDDLAKCKQCPTYQELLEQEAEREGGDVNKDKASDDDAGSPAGD